MANQSDKIFESYYRVGVWQLITQLETIKLSDPENYEKFAAFVNKYRDWAKNIAQLEDLPEVPK